MSAEGAEGGEGEEPVLVEETADGVRLLTMNRPEKKNALSGELVEALVVAFEAAAIDDDVQVVGLTGAGDACCAVADLAGSGGSATARLDDLEGQLREELTLTARALRSDDGRAAIKAVFAKGRSRTETDQEDV